MSLLRATYHSFSAQIDRIINAINLNNPIVLGLIGLIGILIASLIAMLSLKTGVMILGFTLAIPVIYLCFTNLSFGLIATLTAATLIPFVGKFLSAPVGLALDGLLFMMLFSLIVNQTKERDWEFAKNPISYIILIWFFYNCAQVLNPVAQSKMAWLYADEKRFQLIVQWGRFRIFSFFSDPTTYGILMAYMGTFCLVLATGPFKIWQRLALAVSGFLMYAAMVYAGSRTPFVLVPAGLIFFVAVTMKKELIIAGGVMIVLGAGAMMKSTSNPVIYRLQSAFKPTEDASVQVRLDNQARVQPFIQSHPIGAGLGSTGMWGERFTPDSWLASFAHDSSYVRFAVEAGYIGLFLFMLMLFIIMRMALYYYFRCYDPEIRTMYLALATVIFMLGLASYPQEVIPIPPTSIIFFIMLGAIARLKDFDSQIPITDEK